MDSNTESRAMSSGEFKQKIYASLRSSEVINQVKGYLRQILIKELQNKQKHPYGETSDTLFDTIKRRDGKTWQEKAVDNLILRHLQQSRYLYSLSIFQQESGLNSYDKTITNDLLKSFGCKNFQEVEDTSYMSDLSTNGAKNTDDSFLWNFLNHLTSFPDLNSAKEDDKIIVEEINPKQSLADLFKAIDDEANERSRLRKTEDNENRISMHKLAELQRKAEEVANKNATKNFEQWKKIELANVHIKEMQKARDIINEKSQDLEEEYARKRDALLARERAAIDRLNAQRELLEKEHQQQRQLLLQEINQLRMRDKSLHEREILLQNMEMLKLKEFELLKPSSDEQAHGGLHKPDRTSHTSMVSSYAESLRKSLSGKDGLQFEEILKEMESQTKESTLIRQELALVREELNQTKAKMQSPPVVQRSETTPLRKENESLRSRLDDLSRNMSDLQQQYHREQESSIRDEMNKWRQEVDLLSEARKAHEEKQRYLEDMTLKLQAVVNSKNQLSIGPGIPRDLSHNTNKSVQDFLRNPNDRGTAYVEPEPYMKYDLPQSGRVRWADTAEKEPLAHPSTQFHNKKEFGDGGESGNTTTSSHDISSISGIRLDIQQKFKQLEKESEELENTYQKYLRNNYQDEPVTFAKAEAKSSQANLHDSYLVENRTFVRCDRPQINESTAPYRPPQYSLLKHEQKVDDTVPKKPTIPEPNHRHTTRSTIQDALQQQKSKREDLRSNSGSSASCAVSNDEIFIQQNIMEPHEKTVEIGNQSNYSSNSDPGDVEIAKDSQSSSRSNADKLGEGKSAIETPVVEKASLGTLPWYSENEDTPVKPPLSPVLGGTNEPATPKSARERLAELGSPRRLPVIQPLTDEVEIDNGKRENIDEILKKIDQKDLHNSEKFTENDAALSSLPSKEYSEEFLSSLTTDSSKDKEDDKMGNNSAGEEDTANDSSDSIPIDDNLEEMLSFQDDGASASSNSDFKIHKLSLDTKDEPSNVQQEKKNLNVFEDSETSHSFEPAPHHSDDGKNSDADFSW